MWTGIIRFILPSSIGNKGSETMTQNIRKFIVPDHKADAGLISLTSLALATAQLPVARRRQQVTIVSCDPSSETDGSTVKALLHKVAASR
jgi:hypothetical protein